MRNLNFIEQRLGAHQILKGLLLKGFRRVSFFGLELIGRGIHLIDGALQILGELLDGLVLVGQTTAGHALQDGIGLLRKLRLICSDGVDIIYPLLVFELVFVVDQLVCGRNDFFLAPGERFSRIILISAAATAATPLLSLAVFFSEGPHVDEIDIEPLIGLFLNTVVKPGGDASVLRRGQPRPGARLQG